MGEAKIRAKTLREDLKKETDRKKTLQAEVSTKKEKGNDSEIKKAESNLKQSVDKIKKLEDLIANQKKIIGDLEQQRKKLQHK